MRSTRRNFMRMAAATTVGAAAAPTIIPASALGADGKIAPSNRIPIGLIGMGKMMWSHLRGCLSRDEIQVVAICDVESDRLKKCSDLINKTYSERFGKDYKGVAVHSDFRELVARPDIDAVMIATPDQLACNTVDRSDEGR